LLILGTTLNDLHGPPKESKFRRRDSLKGLLPYIRAVCAVGAAAHDGDSRSGFLSGLRTQSTSHSPEYPQPGLAFIPSLLSFKTVVLFGLDGWVLRLRRSGTHLFDAIHLTWPKAASSNPCWPAGAQHSHWPHAFGLDCPGL